MKPTSYKWLPDTGSEKEKKMVRLQDVVVVKKDGKIVTGGIVPFSRVYLEFGETDATEKRTAKATDGDKSVDAGEVVSPVELDRPKDFEGAFNPSKTASSDLFTAAIAYLQEAEPRIDPLWQLLHLASGQLNLDQRKPIHDEKRPKLIKAITEDAAIVKAATALVAGGLYATVEEALIAVKAMKQAA